jgi:hypothetical protein
MTANTSVTDTYTLALSIPQQLSAILSIEPRV